MTRDDVTKLYTEKKFDELNRLAGEMVLGEEAASIILYKGAKAFACIRHKDTGRIVSDWNPMENLDHAHTLRDRVIDLKNAPDGTTRWAFVVVLNPVDASSKYMAQRVCWTGIILGDSRGPIPIREEDHSVLAVADTESAAITLACILASLPKESSR